MVSNQILVTVFTFVLAIITSRGIYLAAKGRIGSEWCKTFIYGNVPLVPFLIFVGTISAFSDGFEFFILSIVSPILGVGWIIVNVIGTTIIHLIHNRKRNRSSN